MSWLDEFWGDLLSEEPLRVAAVWATLDAETKRSVRDHLQKMATEDGWQPIQKQSAQSALAVIESADAPEG